MRTRFEQPRAGDIARMLAGILGVRLQVSPRTQAAFEGRYLARYNDDDGRPVVLCAADLAFVARSGAALSMIAPEVAQEMIDAGAVSNSILANFHEIMNICSRLLMKDSGGAHLRLERTSRPADGHCGIDSLQGAGRVLAFDLHMSGYGNGCIDYVIT